MSNNVAFILGAAVGIAIGAMLEHQRFVKEIQSLTKKHAEPTADESA